MRRINPTIEGKRYEQVSKPTARKLFKQGRTIYLNACLMMPGNVWQSFCPIKTDTIQGTTFETQVNEFEYYNCDSERGKYANFFICIEPPTIQEAAQELLKAWNNKKERNRLKAKFNVMFDPGLFAATFEAIQTIHCPEYIPGTSANPKKLESD